VEDAEPLAHLENPNGGVVLPAGGVGGAGVGGSVNARPMGRSRALPCEADGLMKVAAPAKWPLDAGTMLPPAPAKPML